MPTRPFNACIYTHVCLYFFFKTEWLPFSCGEGEGAFFIPDGPWAPFHEILEAKLVSVLTMDRLITCCCL